MKTIEQLQQATNLCIRQIDQQGGWGEIYKGTKQWATVIFSRGFGWEHVSVSPYKRSEIPSWEDMCKIKDMFFLEEETVVQYHPAKKDYVNNLSNCLHLWRPIDVELPVPDISLV